MLDLQGVLRRTARVKKEQKMWHYQFFSLDMFEEIITVDHLKECDGPVEPVLCQEHPLIIATSRANSVSPLSPAGTNIIGLETVPSSEIRSPWPSTLHDGLHKLTRMLVLFLTNFPQYRPRTADGAYLGCC